MRIFEVRPPLTKQKKIRLDKFLVDRNLAESREKAQRLILAGQVTVGDKVVTKVASPVAPDDIVSVTESERFVSRGGYKLQAALDEFKIDVAGRVTADIGSSTGGFTDCLLQAGAEKVYAVDVGYGQLHWNLRNNPQVVTQ